MNKLKILGTVLALAASASMLCTGCSLSMFSRQVYKYNNADKYKAGDREISETIENIDIDYVSGNVKLNAVDTDKVTITETSNKSLTEDQKVHTWVDGNTLHVKFCASTNGISFEDIEKTLSIDVPSSQKLNDVYAEVSSGSISIKGIEASSVEGEASSGAIELVCSSKVIDLEASSGAVYLTQTGDSDSIHISTSSGHITADVEKADKLDVSASSGSINVNAAEVKDFRSEASSGDGEFRFRNVPQNTSISASSGDVKIYLPEDADVTADVDTSSGEFNYELSFAKKDSHYVNGNGSAMMDIETSSGDVDMYVL